MTNIVQPLLQVREGSDQLQRRTSWWRGIRQEILLRGHGGMYVQYVKKNSDKTTNVFIK